MHVDHYIRNRSCWANRSFDRYRRRDFAAMIFTRHAVCDFHGGHREPADTLFSCRQRRRNVGNRAFRRSGMRARITGKGTINMQESVEKICILDGGLTRVEDGSIYSPGVSVGVPATLSCNAYLIRHKAKWLLWDTGTPDAFYAHPGGKIVADGMRAIVVRTIAAQFEMIGLSPDDVDIIMFSHAHYDHVGNSCLFRNAKWFVQQHEHEAMFGTQADSFGYLPEFYSAMRDNEVELLQGDCDLFDDGAIRLIHTPGLTPGHCSLFVRLPRTGPVILGGDVAHNCLDLQYRRVPSFSTDREASVASMRKIEELARKEGARIWINHDTMQSATLPHAPAWIY
ncbi:N-acyl homoserine lactonase family protein [Paraburkholderia tropica]|uniref:N-acyl homoserine lactonase family protein n=1 Tax=Paraburkholderia tropica TaxID=92647 RepID=UPI001F2217F5|nr:N-acyl homoserine lactonase family protein [Paraburkholderia tropica]MDE1143791.1 N-acyl homoserine lactonase family protein [Paraburkholderia tropica]